MKTRPIICGNHRIKGHYETFFPKLQIIGTATSVNRNLTVDTETSEGLDLHKIQREINMPA